ncbi:hypothetical protein AAS21_gp195 [Pantoea phage vB_PagS_AAS21]|uniref:Uncharacterized protein n=1 Tax=Pantoea phage vB_PagS_AAS21 TaxID=2575261 RepID=A0A4Y5P228_9CAUD|nr:hypothetical protein AAS21_gp195 [Pantoea phage vB_PagS_AAS21]
MITLKQVRTEVNTFNFELDKEDLFLLEHWDNLAEGDLDYLFEKYCHDKDGDYKNLIESYGDEQTITVNLCTR